MSLKERTINIDIMTKRYTKLKYKQGDSNQVLNFKLYKNGSELDLAGYVAGIFYEKPNNEVLEKSGTINSNTIRTTITSGVLNTAGVVKAEIFLTKNTEVSISFALLMEVEESINTSSAVQEQEQWDVIRDLLIAGDNTSLLDDSLTATNKTWSSSKIDSQISGLRNDVENIGKPTDEQVATIINQAIANGDIIAGGLTSTAQTLLISILRNAVFTSDQSASITLLQSELGKTNSGGSGGSGTTQYTISNNLSNATTSNSAVLVDANSRYTAIIRENDGYTLDTITVTMGGTDITRTAVNGTTINIAAVNGNVNITVTTIESSSSGGLIKNGLVGLFDYRTATVESPYNLPGWGNVARAKFSSCEEYFVFNNTGTYTVDPTYGITSNWGPRGMRQMSSPTTPISLNGLSNTVIGLVYGQCICNIYGMITATNIGNSIQFTPHYINSSGSTVKLPSVGITAANYKDRPGYSLYALTESDTELKLYINGKLMHTANSSECTDFVKWYTSEGCAVPHYNGANAYTVAFAVYNRPLSAAEIVEATEYFKAMEVSN